MKSVLLSIIAFSILLCSCATIVSDSSYSIPINSTPQGTKIRIIDGDGIEVYNGLTPAHVTLDASSSYFSPANYMVHFSHAGYVDRVINISATIDGWYFGNFLFGGFIGLLLVDPLTGAMWKINTKHLNETLAKSGIATVDSLQAIPIPVIPKKDSNQPEIFGK